MVKISRSEEDIVNEAKKRYKRCEEWESSARENYLYDLKFVEGDSSNLFQWPDGIARSRSQVDRPCLTVNKTKKHCLQIINDARQNESSIQIRAVGSGASEEAAEIREGIIRHIEYQSNAQAAYACATDTQVKGGIGYYRVTTDYADEDSFDQEIYIRRVSDPLSIYIDPDIMEFDGSDMRFAFVSKDMSLDDYELNYGKSEEGHNSSPLGTGTGDGWENEDHIRVCEYYRRIETKDKLHELSNGETIRESTVNDANDDDTFPTNDGLEVAQQNGMVTQSREILVPKIEWFLIAGSKIVDRNIWPGKYIPICRVVGEETVIDKKLDRKGHTRALIDPQRIYNYWTSSAVEFVALQGKTPYIASSESIEDYEDEWKSANQDNLAVLPYNATDDAGNKLEPPRRADPPQMAPAYISGLQIAKDEMMMASGQYEANMGQRSNEVSGKAVQERQRQGDNSTYHFIDHQSQAVRYCGRIINDLIPHIYDTARVIKILAVDGTQRTIQIDPNQQQSHIQHQDPDDDENFNPQEITASFNPNVGKYDVIVDIGPSFASARQDTFNALTQIIQSDPALMQVAGDLMMKNAPFPEADEIAKRLRNMVPKQALGQAPDPQIGQLQQMLAQQHATMSEMSQKLQKAESKQSEQSMQKDIDWYKAETDRMKAVGGIDPDAMMPIIRQMVSQILGTPVNQLIAAHAQENEAMAGSDTQLQNAQAQQASQQAQQSAQNASQLSAQNAQQSQAGTNK